MLRVINKGEPTVFCVESNSLECINPECRAPNGERRYLTRRDNHWIYRKGKFILDKPRVGDGCPKCKAPLDLFFYSVDIAAFNCNGSCNCMYFTCDLGPKVSRASLEEQGAGKYRCSHIEAARDFALDVSLHSHERTRYAGARGQREERQP